MMKKIYFSFILLMICCSAYTRQGITISGRITDSKSNGISNASVYLLNTNYAVISEKQGGFTIHNIAAGDYIVSISAIGYATINEKLTITKELNQVLVFHLEDVISQLEAVVVTAQKKEENLQYVPVSISALTARQIDGYRLWNIRDMTAIIPNLFAGNPGDGRNVTSIRGITSSSYDPAVATYIDGVNQFTLDTYIPQLFDAERIEVLRGPQGTLYGRNAMGGVVNIITKQPTNKTEGFAEASWGNYGAARYSTGIRTPLVKNKLFFGAAGLYESLNGYYDNTYNSSVFDKQHTVGGNYYLKYLPGSKWKLTLNVKHLASRNNGAFPLQGSADDAFAYPFKVNQDAVTKLVDNTFNSSLSLNYTGKRVIINSQTAYQSNYRYYKTPIDADFSPIDGITIINNYGNKWNNVKVVTEELRFSTVPSSAAVKWTAGIYMFSQNTPNKQAIHFGKDAALVGSPAINYAIINSTKAKSLGTSLFTQGSYALNKKMDIIAGLRYDYQHTKEDVLGEYKQDASPIMVQTRPDTAAAAFYSAFSPMLSIAFRPKSNTNLFASYSRGYNINVSVCSYV